MSSRGGSACQELMLPLSRPQEPGTPGATWATTAQTRTREIPPGHQVSVQVPSGRYLPSGTPPRADGGDAIRGERKKRKKDNKSLELKHWQAKGAGSDGVVSASLCPRGHTAGSQPGSDQVPCPAVDTGDGPPGHGALPSEPGHRCFRSGPREEAPSSRDSIVHLSAHWLLG